MRKFIFYGFLIFIFSISIGYVYSRMWVLENRPQNIVFGADNTVSNQVFNNIKNNNEVIETINEEEKILPTTKFAIKKKFTKCGHFKFNYTELPIEIINLKKEEVSKVYPNWKIESFSKSEVVISKEENKMCEEHFIIKLDNDIVKIYNKSDDEKLNLYMETEISKEYLTESDIEKLNKGMAVYGIGKLNSVLEDFE